MKKIILALLISIAATSMANGQDNKENPFGKPYSYYSLSWNAAFPTGDFSKWVANASPIGFNMGARWFIPGTNLSTGVNLAWQRISQDYPSQTYYADNGIAITAMNYRSSWIIPFQAQIDYHIVPDKIVSPYIGLGIGGDYMEHHLLVQDYDIYDTRWDFSLTPEIGALIKFGNSTDWGALVAFNYKWTTNQIKVYNDRTLENLSMMNLKIGICYIID